MKTNPKAICKQCGAPVVASNIVTGLHGETFCGAACAATYRADFDAFISAEVAAAVIRFKNRTSAQRQRAADYNDWAARVSSAPYSHSANELPAA